MLICRLLPGPFVEIAKMADKLPWGLNIDGLTPGSAKVCRLFYQNLIDD